MTDPQTCKSCGQSYEFVETATGRQMPVDVEPNPAGNVVIVNGKAEVLKKQDPRWFSLPASERRTSHFQTCAYARDYRKRHPVGKAE